MPFNLSLPFDSVIMFTWSDWKTEMRSNRYHYAVRFAQRCPVYFVQPQSSAQEIKIEPSEVSNLFLINVPKDYSYRAFLQLKTFLQTLNTSLPLLWVYNGNFHSLVSSWDTPYKVYHATEDYFCEEFNHTKDVAEIIRSAVQACGKVVSVSAGVLESYKNNCGDGVDYFLSENGCDFSFWSESLNRPRKQSILYQGGISNKIDFDMVYQIVKSLPQYEFWFCGHEMTTDPVWPQIKAEKNVKYFGCLKVEEVRDLAHSATVGLIPFIQNDWITNRSYPLKFFEYLASGLSVVSVPIESVKKYSDKVYFANSCADFLSAIETVFSEGKSRREGVELARLQDYDSKFDRVISWISKVSTEKTLLNPSEVKSLKMLILYDPGSVHVKTVFEHLEAFSKYSKAQIYYAPGVYAFESDLTLEMFDIVVVHYSIRLSLKWHISTSLFLKLKAFGGSKILFIQDEYEGVDVAQKFMKEIRFDICYTCVPEKFIEDVYPKDKFQGTKFITNLTGYVSDELKTISINRKISDRPKDVVYRGRALPFWYGRLCFEKFFIGEEFKRRLKDNPKFVEDIETSDSHRIYGEDWWKFLASGKSTLGTESGSNVFDFDGEIFRQIRAYLLENPDADFETVERKFLQGVDGRILMNQVSPKVFESISLGTVLILFEGEYSGVLQKDKHFICLKKDFSNFGEVLKKLQDHDLLQRIADLAYKDVILSGKYSYQKFIEDIDLELAKLERNSKRQNKSLETLTWIGSNSDLRSNISVMPVIGKDFVSRGFPVDELSMEMDSVIAKLEIMRNESRYVAFYDAVNEIKTGPDIFSRGIVWHTKLFIIELGSYLASKLRIKARRQARHLISGLLKFELN